MHRAQQAADAVLAGVPRKAIELRALTPSEASRFSASLRDDSRDAMYSGVLSIAEAIHGLDRGLYSWATVKLYYSVFYLTRALLDLSGVGVVYSQNTPYAWIALPGETPKRRPGTTHKAVLDVFRQFRGSNMLLSQNIAADDPFQWLMDKREAANYRTPRFCEPNAPSHFKLLGKFGVRRLVNEYVSDTTHQYTFDPDHAMLALPIATLKLLLSEYRTQGVDHLSVDDSVFLCSQFYDKSGPLAEVRKLFGN